MWFHRKMFHGAIELPMKKFREESKKKKSILKIISNRKHNVIDDTMRHDGLLKLIIERYMDGKTGRGRSRMEYVSQITRDMNVGGYRDLKEMNFDGEA